MEDVAADRRSAFQDVVLETPRLRLEPLEPRHAPLLFEQLQDHRLYKYYAGAPPSTVEELWERYAQLATRRSRDGSETWLNWAVRTRRGLYVGKLQATIAANGRATIGYDIFTPYQRRGYGKEALQAMLRFLIDCGVRRCAAVVDVDNVASVRLLESLGFTRVWTGPSEDMPGIRTTATSARSATSNARS